MDERYPEPVGTSSAPDTNPPRARRGREKDAQKRRAILEAAERLFRDPGYDRVSVEAIAAAAGVSKVTVYSHFPAGKEELFGAALACGCEELFEETALTVEEGVPLVEALANLGAGFVRIITGDRVASLHAALLQAAERHPELTQMYFDLAVGRAQAVLTALLARACARGQLACPDPSLAAEQFLALSEGMFTYRHQLGLPIDTGAGLDRYARAAAALFVRGYAPPPKG